MTTFRQQAAIEYIRARANEAELRNDALDLVVWAAASGDAGLLDAAYQFARARRALVARAGALTAETAREQGREGEGEAK